MPANPNATFSFYGDSISDYRAFNTFNISLYRQLDGRARLAENAGLNSVANLGTKPGWDLAQAGTTVTEITKRFIQLVGQDEADIVIVLLGANNYGTAGPGNGSAQDWIARADDIIRAAAAAGKTLVFLPPIDHQNDPIIGREALKAYLPTVASATVIVPDTSGFDAAIHTDDGVHPNKAGGQFLADVVADALSGEIVDTYVLPAVDGARNLVVNGDLNGTGGILKFAAQGQTAGQVADGWTLTRISGTGVARGSKFIGAGGDEGQRITYDEKGSVRLEQNIVVNGKAGEQYEIVFQVRVQDPNNRFLGIWAQDGDVVDGVRLFEETQMATIYQAGTGSFDTVFRSPKLTLREAETMANVRFILAFEKASGAIVDISDVRVIKVANAPPIYVPPTGGGNGLPSEDQIITALILAPDTLVLTSARDVFVHKLATAVNVLGADGNDDLTGGKSGDVLIGERGDDRVNGADGDDTLVGGLGNDTVAGGIGNDRVLGGEDADNLTGGTGVDTLEGGAGDDMLDGGEGNDTVDGGDGNDTLFLGGGVGDNVGIGGPGDDIITGAAGNDSINGDAGNDRVFAAAGDDRVFGGEGSDRLNAGDGNDTLRGDAGADMLTGGRGADVFVFNSLDAVDRVTDFKVGEGDKLDLSAILDTSLVYDGGSLVGFVQFSQFGEVFSVGIDLNGRGNYTQLAQLVGAAGLGTPDSLAAAGLLIA
jgi:Ca2+-binding RTX toxin-like protein